MKKNIRKYNFKIARDGLMSWMDSLGRVSVDYIHTLRAQISVLLNHNPLENIVPTKLRVWRSEQETQQRVALFVMHSSILAYRLKMLRNYLESFELNSHFIAQIDKDIQKIESKIPTPHVLSFDFALELADLMANLDDESCYATLGGSQRVINILLANDEAAKPRIALLNAIANNGAFESDKLRHLTRILVSEHMKRNSPSAPSSRHNRAGVQFLTSRAKSFGRAKSHGSQSAIATRISSFLNEVIKLRDEHPSSVELKVPHLLHMLKGIELDMEQLRAILLDQKICVQSEPNSEKIFEFIRLCFSNVEISFGIVTDSRDILRTLNSSIQNSMLEFARSNVMENVMSSRREEAVSNVTKIISLSSETSFSQNDANEVLLSLIDAIVLLRAYPANSRLIRADIEQGLFANNPQLKNLMLGIIGLAQKSRLTLSPMFTRENPEIADILQQLNNIDDSLGMKNSVRLMTPVNIIKVVTALQNPANHTKSGNHTGTVHKPNPRLDSGQFKRRI